MSKTVHETDGKRRIGLLTVIMTLGGLVLGGATGWGEGRLLKAADRYRLSWSDHGAMMIAIVFLGTGVLTMILAANRRGLAMLANPHAPDFARPPSRGQAGYYGLQGGVLILAGAMLAAPVAFQLLSAAGHAPDAPFLMAAVAGAFVLQTALNIRIWVKSDEVQRKVIAESGAASFWLLQGLYFLWACGEKLALLPRISSWDAVTVMMGVYILASTVLFYRRGLG
jgi:hypothetical protein